MMNSLLLYPVNGEFIGGCDIVLGMHESGELKELLQEQK
jgi:monothiol glutaredoxin